LYFSFLVSIPDLPKLRIVSLVNRAFTLARPASFTHVDSSNLVKTAVLLSPKRVGVGRQRRLPNWGICFRSSQA
jgi:hypothetical protein